MNRAAGEAERRRRARARKGQPATTVVAAPCPPAAPEGIPWDACPKGGKHVWFKPNPRPADHKYECEKCGHYDLDDYQ